MNFNFKYILAFLCLLVPPALKSQQLTFQKQDAGKFQLINLPNDSSFNKRINWNGEYFFLLKTKNNTPPAYGDAIKIYQKTDNDLYFVKSALAPATLLKLNNTVSEVYEVNPEEKISKALISGKYEKAEVKQPGKLKLSVTFFTGVNTGVVESWFKDNHIPYELINNSDQLLLYEIEANGSQLTSISELPVVSFINESRKDFVLNEKSKIIHNATSAGRAIVDGGFGLKGEGIIVGVGDDGAGLSHVDLKNRVISYAGGIVNNHGSHVTGTIVGGGLRSKDREGYAPKAKVINQFFSGVLKNAKEYVDRYGMVLTNNSYGNANGDCMTNGQYDSYSALVDNLAFERDELLNIFAVGNSGDMSCTPFPQRYNTILAGYQTSKNGLAVGNLWHTFSAAPTSSTGPTTDGRLKPEVIAIGVLSSTLTDDAYDVYFGTSMAAPATTGQAALLIEQYRKKYNTNPKSGLIKALIMNGAKDIGNYGPDYIYGYGVVNFDNSIRMLNDEHFKTNSIQNNEVQTYSVTVPANAAFLKAMIYWHDPVASILSAKKLINDLDIEVVYPDGTTIEYPLVLDGNYGSVTATALPGVDRVNNSEQITIKTPQPGTYTIRVKGYNIQQGLSQQYFMVYDFVPKELRITSPKRAETWPITNIDENYIFVYGIVVNWFDEGYPDGDTYKLEYTTNNGSTWNSIITNLAGTLRHYGWKPPAAENGKTARLRITRNNANIVAVSDTFLILERLGFTVPSAGSCHGAQLVTWPVTSGIDSVEIIMVKNDSVVPVKRIKYNNAAGNYMIYGLNKDSTYFIGARSVKNNQVGHYNTLVRIRPNSTSCTSELSKSDLAVIDIPEPSNGRELTSSSLATKDYLRVLIKNNSNAVIPAGSYKVKYSINGGTLIEEPGKQINSLDTLSHIFYGLNFSAPNTSYEIKVIVENTAKVDIAPINDTLIRVVKNLPNPNLMSALVTNNLIYEGFETAAKNVYQGAQFGMAGIERWDLTTTTVNGQARSDLPASLSVAGVKSLALENVSMLNGANSNNLVGTFNLDGVNSFNNIRLDFKYKYHGVYQNQDFVSNVGVRGDDKKNWINVFNITDNLTLKPGEWHQSPSIDILNAIKTASPVQALSTSTQLRFIQGSLLGISDNTNFAGISFDDIRLYQAVNDVELVEISSPKTINCGLTSTTNVTVVIRNTMNYAVTNFTLRYSVNNGPLITEAFNTTIPANSSRSYTFTSKANLAAFGKHSLECEVITADDNVSINNKKKIEVINQPLISSFPFINNFETDNGQFIESGINSSWQWGVPASNFLQNAASSAKVWKTNLTGFYNNGESSSIMSPCFNLGVTANPKLSFSYISNIEDCSSQQAICDYVALQYSLDGINWTTAGSYNQDNNLYDGTENLWYKQNSNAWKTATAPLPNLNNLRFRFAINTDEATAFDGFALDNVYIYDDTKTIEDKVGTTTITANVDGSQIVNFISPDNKYVVQLDPQGQDLGLTEVTLYKRSGAVANFGGQYLFNRSFTIKPANRSILGNDVRVRLYLTNAEMKEMQAASGCVDCSVPLDYTKLGITKFSSVNRSIEDNNLNNNAGGIYEYISPNQLTALPFQNGFYFDFDINTFSEFWFNDGKDSNIPLNNKWVLLDLVRKTPDVALLKWTPSTQLNVLNYTIEYTNTGNGFATGNFTSVTVPVQSIMNYQHELNLLNGNGVYYFRIKQNFINEPAIYSPVKTIFIDGSSHLFSAFPNPVNQQFIHLQFNNDKAFNAVIRMVDVTGKVVYTERSIITAFQRKTILFNRIPISAGMYNIQVFDGVKWYSKPVLKH